MKPEQETAVISLQRGEPAPAVLPAGFGKSVIFTVFALSARELNRPVSVLVICPLKSIILDYIAEFKGLCSAAELTPESLPKIIEDTPSFFFLRWNVESWRNVFSLNILS